jgi:iron complex outermembrane recepter protein
MPIQFRRAPRASCLSVAIAAPLVLPAIAVAQTTTLDKVVVTTGKAALDAQAGTGTRLDLSLLETPASVVVIDRATLDARGVRNTQEALFGIPGLAVASPPGNGNAVTLRGFSGSQISQLFNGIDVQYASIAARPVDGWQYERVEAIGGPSSFLYGAGAVGGSINYVTRLARLDSDRLQSFISAGSFGSAVAAVGINQRLGAEAARNALRVDASFSHSDGWVDRNRREALTSAASLLSQITRTLTHTLALEYQQERSDRPYWGTPALLDGDGRLRVRAGTEGRNYNVGDGLYAQDVLWARSLLEWQVSERSRIRNTLYHYDALRDYRNVENYRFNTDASAVIRSGTLLQRHDQQLYSNRLEWSHDGALGGLPSQWNIGLDVSYNRQTRFPLSVSATVDEVPLDAVTPGRFYDVPGTAPVYTPDRTNRLHTQAMFAENLTRLTDRLSLLTGLRHDRIHLDVLNLRTVTPTNPARFDRRYSPTTGRMAVNYAVTPSASVYAQISTAADPPAGVLSTANFATLRDFDLSTGRQTEAGAKFQFPGGNGYATVAAYRIVRRNLAIADPDRPGQTLPVGQQSSRGIETTFALRPTASLSLQGNLAWVDANLDDFYENVGGVPVSRAGNRPANTPARVGNLWLDYTFAPRWSAGVDLRALSARYANAANTVSAAGYVLWGATVSWQPVARTRVTLRGRNLGDKTYVAHTLGDGMVYLGEPRSWELSLRTDF